MRRRALLVHGFASSWANTWEQAGWRDLLLELDIEAVPFELPGHGESTLDPSTPLPAAALELLATDPDADLVLGFSAGAMLALHAMVARPARFARVALLGLGDGMWSTSGSAPAADRFLDGSDPHDELLRVAATNAGNDLGRVAEFLGAGPAPPPLESLSVVRSQVLLVVGALDPVGPPDRVAAALPDARVVMLAGVDHFRTPSSPAAMAAVVDFFA